MYSLPLLHLLIPSSLSVDVFMFHFGFFSSFTFLDYCLVI